MNEHLRMSMVSSIMDRTQRPVLTWDEGGRIRSINHIARNASFEKGHIKHYIADSDDDKFDSIMACLNTSHTMELVSDVNDQSMLWTHIKTFDEADRMMVFSIGNAMMTGNVDPSMLTLFNNRQAFEDAANILLEEEKAFTVYLIDMDDFKSINEQHGYSYGDYYLACLFEAFYKLSLMTFRLSGDQMALIEESVDEATVFETLNKIHDIVDKTCMNDSIKHTSTCCVGILKCPEYGDTIEAIERHVDIAINEAKSRGPDSNVIYDPNLKDKLDRRRGIEQGIKNVLATDGFEIYLQPIFDLVDNQYDKFEVLLRWPIVAGKEICIGEVIEVAEKTGQITDIDAYVVDKVFSLIKEYARCETYCINISAKSFYSGCFINYLEDKLSEHKINPNQIELEITEYSCVKEIEKTRLNMERIKAMGFKIALDDFGTDYSSLNYLGKLPFDTLKIDKSYVDEIHNPSDRIILKHLIALARDLELETIAEGIEHEDQKLILKELGCKYGQGYLASRPMAFKTMLNIESD
ncbi:GGDEF domain-containing protein [Acidaminobacter sp. JC074]|uniref:putative bifunctional diguanylate cyclase/phosphodiesterase n=1 Tax=Acidaminobacter sp. JC074 TaxID=2530199 RepID=UPI001F10CB79|nr:bifunctional diguanylate cyclase/phosphodiesterase [Acidaminobacter sp. JC074]MCH4890627.1 GGDEF domain-containing protein [Acidaminobacter sp. JC074]